MSTPPQTSLINTQLVVDDSFVSTSGSLGPENIPILIEASNAGPGADTGGIGVGSQFIGVNMVAVNSQRAVKQLMNLTMENYAQGDTAGIYAYVNTVGGTVGPSDEGVTGITVEVEEFPSYYIGEVQSISTYVVDGVEIIAPVISPFSSSPPWTSDGGILLNTNVTPEGNIISGNMTGPSVKIYTNGLPAVSPNTGVPTDYLNALPVDIPSDNLKTTAWAYLSESQGLPPTNLTNDLSASVTLTVTLNALPTVIGDPPAFKNGIVRIAGTSFSEQAVLSGAQPPQEQSAGSFTQTITLSYRYPNANLYLFQGGVANRYISFDANLKLSGLRSTYTAVGFLTSGYLIYIVSDLGVDENFTLPLVGCEAASTDLTLSPLRNGLQLYSGAEVVAVQRAGTSEAVLEPNDVQWDAGDLVECPLPKFFSGRAAFFSKTQNSPALQQDTSIGLDVLLKGPGVAQSSIGMLLSNGSPESQYYSYQDPTQYTQYPPPVDTSKAGPLGKPVGLRIAGFWSSTILIENGPDPMRFPGSPPYADSALIAVQSGAASPWVLIALPQGKVIYDPVSTALIFGPIVSSQVNASSFISTSNDGSPFQVKGLLNIIGDRGWQSRAGDGLAFNGDRTSDSPAVSFYYGDNLNFQVKASPYYDGIPGLSGFVLRFSANGYEINSSNLAGIDASGNLGLVGKVSALGQLSGRSVVTSRGTPGSSTDSCVKGEIWSDDSFLYVGVETNVIRRVALESF